MKIELGLAAVGGAKDARTSTKATGDAPAFALPQHTSTPPTARAPASPVAAKAERLDAPHGATRERLDRLPVRDAARNDASTPASPPAGTRTTGADADAARTGARQERADATTSRDAPNAASRRESKPHDAAESNRAAEPVAEAPRDAGTAPTGTTRAADTDTDGEDDTAALPDRMLALLSGDWSAPPAPTASAGSAPPSALAIGASLPTAATTSPDATALPLALPTPAPPATPNPALAVASPANGAIALATLPPASNDTGTDASAVLAAMVDGMPGRTKPTSDTTTTTSPLLAFNPLAPRGVDPLQTAARAINAAMPTSIPLALDAAFDDGIGNRITWMADQRIDRAEIRLSPEALGPIDVRLQMDGHRVNAQFHAANADVRQALESGMDRLRDLLGRQGMELGQSQVGGGARDGRGPASSAAFAADTADAGNEPQRVTTIRALPARGLLDEYA